MTSHLNSIKTARRSDREYNVSLTKRRLWYTDPPAGDPPATPPVVPPTPEPKPEPKFTQAELDAIAGRTRKEATDSARKALLKELGLDPDDPKAVDTVKGRLTAAQQAEDAKKSAEEKALEKIAQLEKERDEAKTLAEKVQLERRMETRDSKIIKALEFAHAKTKDANDLLILMDRKKPELVKAVMKDDGEIDAKALEALVAATKADYKDRFTGGGPSIPSNQGGRASDPDSELTKAAQQASFIRSRRTT